MSSMAGFTVLNSRYSFMHTGRFAQELERAIQHCRGCVRAAKGKTETRPRRDVASRASAFSFLHPIQRQRPSIPLSENHTLNQGSLVQRASIDLSPTRVSVLDFDPSLPNPQFQVFCSRPYGSHGYSGRKLTMSCRASDRSTVSTYFCRNGENQLKRCTLALPSSMSPRRTMPRSHSHDLPLRPRIRAERDDNQLARLFVLNRTAIRWFHTPEARSEEGVRSGA